MISFNTVWFKRCVSLNPGVSTSSTVVAERDASYASTGAVEENRLPFISGRFSAAVSTAERINWWKMSQHSIEGTD